MSRNQPTAIRSGNYINLRACLDEFYGIFCKFCLVDSNKQGIRSKRYDSKDSLKKHLSHAHKDIAKSQRSLAIQEITRFEKMVESGTFRTCTREDCINA